MQRKHLDDRLCYRRILPYVEQTVRIEIDDSLQPVTLIVQLNHSFIDLKVIRTGPSVNCRSVFVTTYVREIDNS